MMRILITGANGFVGTHLSRVLHKAGAEVIGTSRNTLDKGISNNKYVNKWVELDLDSDSNNYSTILENIDIVIHLASRVHNMRDKARTSQDVYYKTNSYGTLNLAKASSDNGVRRFIFLSSIKVNGEMTNYDGVYKFTETDEVHPDGPYALSKLEAENNIKKVCNGNEMEYTILRPSLIYGPGVKANVFKLFQVVNSGLPLPLANITNIRSIIFVENLCDAILKCTIETNAANKLYLVSDTDISTPELIRVIANQLHRKERLFPVFAPILKLAAYILNKQSIISRLTDSLVIDSRKIKKELSWMPRHSLNEGMEKTALWYREQVND